MPKQTNLLLISTLVLCNSVPSFASTLSCNQQLEGLLPQKDGLSIVQKSMTKLPQQYVSALQNGVSRPFPLSGSAITQGYAIIVSKLNGQSPEGNLCTVTLSGSLPYSISPNGKVIDSGSLNISFSNNDMFFSDGKVDSNSDQLSCADESPLQVTATQFYKSTFFGIEVLITSKSKFEDLGQTLAIQVTNLVKSVNPFDQVDMEVSSQCNVDKTPTSTKIVGYKIAQ